MKYKSPLHFLPKRDIYTLSPADVKRWKQEVLLQFDLHQSSAITINDNEYDKSTVLQAFDRLKEHPKHHLSLYQNKALLKFIEEGNTGFFSGLKNYTHFQDASFRDWIAPFFIPQYDEAVYQFVSSKERAAFHSLNKLCNSKFPFPEEWQQEEVYQKAHRFLTDFVEKANAILNDEAVFVVREKFKKKLDIKPEVSEYIDMHRAKMLDVLPDIFEQVRYDYGKFNADVMITASNKDEKVKTLTDKSFETMQESHQICRLMHGEDISLLGNLTPDFFIAGTFNIIDHWVKVIVFSLVGVFIILPLVGFLILQLIYLIF